MSVLPSSIYVTPGRRAFGDAGILQAPDPFEGLQVAERYRTEWWEEGPLPTFGYLTVKGKGKDPPLTSLFLALQLIHLPDEPDRAAVRGVWAVKLRLFWRSYSKKFF